MLFKIYSIDFKIFKVLILKEQNGSRLTDNPDLISTNPELISFKKND